MESHDWDQDSVEVRVDVPIPAAIKAKDVAYTLTPHDVGNAEPAILQLMQQRAHGERAASRGARLLSGGCGGREPIDHLAPPAEGEEGEGDA